MKKAGQLQTEMASMDPERLLDRFLPFYDYDNRHGTVVHARGEVTYRALRSLDFSGASLPRMLFKLRGIPVRAASIDGLLRLGFVLLDEIEESEVVLGIVGRFWRPDGDLRCVGKDDFFSFDEKGYVKAAWSFRVAPSGSSDTLLTTETRISCCGPTARVCFGIYWMVVSPFSGLIRRSILRAVKATAESMQRCGTKE